MSLSQILGYTFKQFNVLILQYQENNIYIYGLNGYPDASM